MSQISMLLLTNGDEVFGEIKNENERGVDIDNALVAHYTTISGTPTIIFRKFCTFTNNFDVFFKREHIVATFKDIREDVLKSYKLTMKLYIENGIPSFADADDVLDFNPDIDSDGFDDVDDIDFEDDSMIEYSYSKKTVH